MSPTVEQNLGFLSVYYWPDAVFVVSLKSGVRNLYYFLYCGVYWYTVQFYRLLWTTILKLFFHNSHLVVTFLICEGLISVVRRYFCRFTEIGSPPLYLNDNLKSSYYFTLLWTFFSCKQIKFSSSFWFRDLNPNSPPIYCPCPAAPTPPPKTVGRGICTYDPK